MSDSDSSGNSIDDSFWRNSPSLEAEDERDEDGEEWPFEIVGEEVDADGEVRYEVDWDNWKRADGTTQTWQPMDDSLTKEWRHIQKRERDAILKDSIDIELDAFSGVDLHNDKTRLRVQAYEEKLVLRRRYSPKLEEQMAKLLAEKLASGMDLDNPPSPTNAAPATPASRGLRLTAVRQQRQKIPTSEPQESARSRDNAIRPMSTSSSESSSRPHVLPSTPVPLRRTVTPVRGSQDRASRKREIPGKIARQKRSAEELETDSDDAVETEYRKLKGLKRVRIISPQIDEVEGEEDEGDVVDNESAESEHDEKPMTPGSVEDGDGGYLDIDSDSVESSDVEMGDVAGSRPRTRSQTVDESIRCSVTVKEIPDKKEKRKRNTRGGKGKRLRMKYGEGNPCDRCEMAGIVCLSRNQGNSCLKCFQKKRKCGSSVQSKSRPRTNRGSNRYSDSSPPTKSQALQGITSEHGPRSEKQIASFTKAIDAPILPIKQLTKSVDMLNKYVQQLIRLIKMDLEMRWEDTDLESDKAAEVVMSETLDRATLLKMQRDADYKQYKPDWKRADSPQARGVVEPSEKVTKFGRHPASTFDHSDFSSVCGDLSEVPEKSTMCQKNEKAVEKLTQERKRKAEERTRREARFERNRFRKGKGKVVEDEDEEDEFELSGHLNSPYT